MWVQSSLNSNLKLDTESSSFENLLLLHKSIIWVPRISSICQCFIMITIFFKATNIWAVFQKGKYVSLEQFRVEIRKCWTAAATQAPLDGEVLWFCVATRSPLTTKLVWDPRWADSTCWDFAAASRHQARHWNYLCSNATWRHATMYVIFVGVLNFCVPVEQAFHSQVQFGFHKQLGAFSQFSH